ncbi:MAG: barstar family protein, partial [Clostridia bacterium]|nr:barstar family protein [Clostridia bacterium]
CLTDLTGEIRLYHAAEMRRSLPGYAEKILRVFSDAQSDMLRIEIVD